MNHSLHFKDPVTGIHAQFIESYWNRVKIKLKRMRGCHRDQLPSYLDESMWLERHGKVHAWSLSMCISAMTYINILCKEQLNCNYIHNYTMLTASCSLL